MKKTSLFRTIILAGSLLLQLSTLCFHSNGAVGDVDLAFDPGSGVTNPVSAIVVLSDGKVLVGDTRTFVNGTNLYGRARLNANGSSDGTFVRATNFVANLAALIPDDDCGPGYECSKYTSVDAVAVQSDGKVLVGGYGLTVSCDPGDGGCVYFYRYFLTRRNDDGSPDTGFASAVGDLSAWYFQTVRALAVQPDGKIIVGGWVTSIKGTNRNGIARLNADGSLDNSFNPGSGANGIVSSVALQPNGKVLIAGGFTSVNGTNRNGIARLNTDSSLDGSFHPGTGVSGQVLSIALQSDGKVLFGGSFTSLNGTNRNNIARLNANGTLDGIFNPGTGPDGVVRSIALQSDGKVLVGGDFTTIQGVLRPHLARLHGDSIVVPSLSIARSNAFAIILWPATGLNFQLQENTDLSLPNSWSPVAQPAMTNAGQISVTVPTSVGGRKFFRLESQ